MSTDWSGLLEFGRRGNVSGHFEVEAGHARHAARAGQQLHFAHAQIAQDLRADAVDARIPLGRRTLSRGRRPKSRKDIAAAFRPAQENDDGTMARLPDLVEFGRQHGLKIGTIADLIHYRSQHESIVERVAERTMRTAHGTFRAVAYRDTPSRGAHLALVNGDLAPDLETLVRVHQPVSILDLLETDVTTHSWNMASALEAIKSAERGVVVLLNCEESADEMFAQFDALAAPQEQRTPSRSARMDLRTYGIGAQILKDLGVRRMTLLASPRKMPSMTGFNLEVMGF